MTIVIIILAFIVLGLLLIVSRMDNDIEDLKEEIKNLKNTLNL